jgi:hypothetical protein
MDDKPNKESISPEHHHAVRPLCNCCGGGEHRKGYTRTKSKSRKMSRKARKPKYKDKRN